MNNEVENEQSQSVDIKEYLAILWRRKWLVLFCGALSLGGMTVFLFTRQPIWRINAKLLVTHSGSAMPASEIVHEEDTRFVATQIEVMQGPTMLRKIQQRMKKTPQQIEENLTSLKITQNGGTDILLIMVDTPAQEFGREFINVLVDEYLKFRERQRATSSESAVQTLTREIDRLGLELKAANHRLYDFSKEHNTAGELIAQASSGGGYGGGGTDFWERWRHHANVIMHAGEELADAVARKQLLDSRPNAAAVLSLLADERAAAAEARAAETSVSGEIKAGAVLNISVPQYRTLDDSIPIVRSHGCQRPHHGCARHENPARPRRSQPHQSRRCQ